MFADKAIIDNVSETMLRSSMMKVRALAVRAAFAAMSFGGAACAATTPLPGCADAIAYSHAHGGLSVLVLEDGRTVCSSSAPSEAHELWSGTKSLIGLMAAAAVQDGFLALDERAADTLTEWRNDPQKSAITLRQLLSMTSGHPSTIGRPQGYADSLAIALSAAPGTRFQYGPAPLQIFGEVVRRKLRANGQDADPRHYLERRLLAPLGVAVARWRNGPDGHPLMPQGVALSAEHWAKIGEFVRAGGMHHGKLLVDKAALAALFQGSAVNPAYGLTWWLPRATPANDPVTGSTDITDPEADLSSDMVVAAGAGGQRLYVIPSHKLTIVRQARLSLREALASGQNNWSDRRFLSILLKH